MLWVGDAAPRKWTGSDLDSLREIADSVVAQIELQRERDRVARERDEAVATLRPLESLVEHMPGMAYRCLNSNDQWRRDSLTDSADA
jgi:GAF domain-containing protein